VVVVVEFVVGAVVFIVSVGNSLNAGGTHLRRNLRSLESFTANKDSVTWYKPPLEV
jgi:hypothetical protein